MKTKNFKFSSFTSVVLLMFAAVLMTGCVSKRSVTYFNDVDEMCKNGFQIPTTYDIRIQPNDQLAITVASSEKELLEPFCNKVMIGSSSGNAGAYASKAGQYFVVNKDGYIDFPVFGALKVGGLSRDELARKIEKMFKDGGYTQDPVVTIDIISFHVTVMGETGNVVVESPTDRMTIIEALAQAGGVKITGKRQDVLVLREDHTGKVTSYRVDVSDAKSTLESPVYYLKQNDVIYVAPNGAARVDGSPFYRYMAALSAIAGMAVTLVSSYFIFRRR